MHAINLLKQQHQEVRDLFERINQAEDTSEKETLFQELADNLAAHMTIEEMIFYPAAFTTDDTKYAEAVDEHAASKRVLASLLEMSADDEDFEDKLTKLQELVEAHVEDEESELFKTAKRDLEADELRRLGEEMKVLYDEEMAGHPSRNVPDEVAEQEEDETDEVELDPNAEMSPGE
jgi:hemerythrin-like domain-containing protein